MLNLTVAGPDDVAFITTVQNLPHVVQFLSMADAAHVRDSIQHPDEVYWIAVDDEKGPVGFAHLVGMENPNKCVEIRRLAINTPGFGFGKQFFSLMLSRLFHDEGKHRVWLDVFPDNAGAHHLYQQHGFVEEGVLRDAYRRDDGFKSVILMSILAPEFFALESGRAT